MTDRVHTIGLLMLLGVGVVVGAVLYRVGQLQVDPGEQLMEHMSSRYATREVPAVRGDLLDRRGRPLSSTRFAYRVIVDPELLPEDPFPLVGELSRTLGDTEGGVGSRVFGAIAENTARRSMLDRVAAAPGPAAAPAAPRVADMLSALGLDAQAQAALAAADAETSPSGPRAVDAPELKPLIRYVPVSGVIERDLAERVAGLRLRGVYLERRPLREYPGGSAVASIVGKVGFEHRGLMGAELTLDTRLSGQPGRLRYVRDAQGRPLWTEPGMNRADRRGEDIRLGLDLELQRIAVQELVKGVQQADARGGRLVMVDPATGEILAMADVYRDVPGLATFPWVDPETPRETWPSPANGGVDWSLRFDVIPDDPARQIHPALGRNRCVEDVYEPGSTFKPFMWAVPASLGLLPTDEIVETGPWYKVPYGRRVVRDVTRRDEMTWDEVLVYSSNIGMTKALERVSFEQVHGAILDFGFGSRTNIGLPGETGGLVTSLGNWSDYTQTSVSFGYEVAVTPVQMARAFTVFARSHDQTGSIADLRLTASEPGEWLTGERVLDPAVVQRVRKALGEVVGRMDATRLRRYPDDLPVTYPIFGKSGTANIAMTTPKGKRRPPGTRGYFENQYNSSFIASGPTDDPRLVILVVIDDPGPALVRNKQHYGSSVAGPVVRRVMERSLRYLGVAPPREDESAAAGRAVAAAE